MLRKDREIKGFHNIIDIMERSQTLRLAMVGNTYPYIVPLSYGYDVQNENCTLYVHGAKIGEKHTLIEKNNKVCIEMDLFHGYHAKEKQVTTLYESVIGFGEIIRIEGEEAIHGLACLMKHCGYEPIDVDEQILSMIKVYKIVLHEISGKANLL